MRLAIMQPYFLPYIGYFQLMAAVDRFVVYDNIQFSKGGWVNRNRIFVNGAAQLFSLPLRKDSDYLEIRQRFLAGNFPEARTKILRQIEASYRKAPMFQNAMPVVKCCFEHSEHNLFDFIYHSLQQIAAYLGISTPLIVSSTLQAGPSQKGEQRVIETCRELGADFYINAINGRGLYEKATFEEHGIHLAFLKTREFTYPQAAETFVPYLSIIDIIMFNSLDRIRQFLREYDLV